MKRDGRVKEDSVIGDVHLDWNPGELSYLYMCLNIACYIPKIAEECMDGPKFLEYSKDFYSKNGKMKVLLVDN